MTRVNVIQKLGSRIGYRLADQLRQMRMIAEQFAGQLFQIDAIRAGRFPS